MKKHLSGLKDNYLPIAIFIATLLFASCRKVDKQSEENPSAPLKSYVAKETKYVPNEVLITFKGTEDNNIGKSVGGSIKEKVYTKAMKHFGDKPFFVLSVPNVSNAVEALKKNPNIQSVSLHPIVTIPQGELVSNSTATIAPVSKAIRVESINKSTTKPVFTPPSVNNKTASTTETYPNDALYTSGEQWGANNIKASQAWATNKGSQQIYVGLIGEGVFFWHPDLCGQVDVKHSYDFLHNDSSIFDFADGHETHTAGIIAANTNNGIGIAGVSPNVTIVSAKFLQQSGTLVDGIKCIDHITNLKINHNMNFVATNNSWGYQGPPVQELYDAINRQRQAGILFIAAAGNNAGNNDESDFYPADFGTSLDNVISVASINSNDNLSGYSNYGLTTVHIGAPGENVVSTLYDGDLNPIYLSLSGTSMAAPQVTGAAVLYKSGHPTATYLQVKAAILNSARPIAALAGKTITGGTLDVSSFTQGSSDVPVERSCQAQFVDITPPTQVQNVRVTATTNNSITISWDASTDPESGIYFYGIYVTQGGIGYQQLTTFNTFATHSQLAEGAEYCYTVYAINKQGRQSIGSATLCAKTTGAPDITPPSVPTNVRLVASTLTSLAFDWNVSTDNRGVEGYDLSMSNLPGTWTSGGYIRWTGYNFTNIPTDTYWFRVRAFDLSGNRSAWCDTVFATTGDTPPPPPPPPPADYFINTSLVVSPIGSLQTSSSFTYFSNGTISLVQLERKKGNGSFSSIKDNPASPYVDRVPNPGSYTYRLKVVLTNGKIGYSDEVLVKINKK